jgi:hypothetical protein
MTCDQITNCDHGGFQGSNAPDVRGSIQPSNLAIRVLSHGEMPKTDEYETTYDDVRRKNGYKVFLVGSMYLSQTNKRKR